MSDTNTEQSNTVQNSERHGGITLLAVEIVSAYVANNSVPAADLPGLIQRIHAALTELRTGGHGARRDATQIDRPSNAAIRKSICHDGLVSFIDGKTYKTLKRHLTANGLTPELYRERYGLPSDYPLVAPSYTQQRSALAKSIGLGRPGGAAQAA